jgi:hypothetical protein
MNNNNDISNNDISNSDISNNDISNNFIVDLSNSNLNETNDSIANLMQNIFNDVARRRREDISNNQINLENNHERLRYFFNNNNQSFDNLFQDINPMLLSTSEFRQPSITSHPLLTMDLDEIFSNLISNIRGNTRTGINSFNNILNQSFDQDENKYKKILSDKGKEQLKKIKFKDSSKNNNSCPIFHTDFENDDTIIELPCLHCFVPEAIERWLSEESAQCPVCRFELDSEEVKIKEKNDVINNENNNEEVDVETDAESDIDNQETNDDIQDENRQIQQAILESLKD